MAEELTPAEKWMKAGMNLELAMCEGMIMADSFVDQVAAVKKRLVRDDDIFLCTYPKSGTHWMWEILNMIVAGKAEYAKHWQNSAWLEYRTEVDLEELGSPRILHTHLLPRMLPTALWKKRSKIVYMERNLKDIVVSAYNQNTKQVWTDLESQTKPIYTGTWEDFLNLFIRHGSFVSWFDYITPFHNIKEDHPDADICYVKYEDMKQDCTREIRRVAEFLERPLSEATCQEIAEACSFQKLKHVSENEKDQTFHIPWKEGEEGYFRKGVIGDWKNYFTVAQSEMFDKFYEEKTKKKYPET